MPDLPQLAGTVHALVAAARHELDPHVPDTDDLTDHREIVARKVVARVLRELGTATYDGDGSWGEESQPLDTDRFDELAAELEDGVA
jgi:hypothetical protein